MQNKSIAIISTGPENNTRLRINNSHNFPFLEYTNEFGEDIGLLYSDSLAKISDLYYILRNKLKSEKVYYDSSQAGEFQLYLGKEIPDFPDLSELPQYSISTLTNNISDPGTGTLGTDYIELEKFCEKVMNTKNTITLDSSREADISISTFYGLVQMLDFLNHKRIIDIVSYYGYQYTSSLNLGQYISEDLTGIKLGISYNKEGKEYASEIFLNPRDSETNLSIYSGPDINVEFDQGCIKLFPLSNYITECIISYCFLIYD